MNIHQQGLVVWSRLMMQFWGRGTVAVSFKRGNLCVSMKYGVCHV